jgi:hypothetical protein
VWHAVIPVILSVSDGARKKPYKIQDYRLQASAHINSSINSQGMLFIFAIPMVVVATSSMDGMIATTLAHPSSHADCPWRCGIWLEYQAAGS